MNLERGPVGCDWQAALERLADEDFLGQLLERRGRAAELATEAGDVKLDWVDQMAWGLADPEALRSVEELAGALRREGYRHLVWTGMGGSVGVVRVLGDLGILAGAVPQLHVLDSTDPAALNRLLEAITGDGEILSELRATAMVAVSMGMTSEEPITHLEWFEGLLLGQGITNPSHHMLAMTLPGSYLDRHALAAGVRRFPIQLDGGSGTAGRMSAPSTRVFLLPAAIALGGDGTLREVVEACQTAYRLRPGMTAEERSAVAAGDSYLRLAAWLSANLAAGRDMVLLDLPARLSGLAGWVEQVVEESLGKNGRGLLVFADQDFEAATAWPDRYTVVRVDQGSGAAPTGRPEFQVDIGLHSHARLPERLSAVARFCAGWNLAVAALGYLEDITFAGQPAVEAYKRHARHLRNSPGALEYPEPEFAEGGLSLHLGTLQAAGLPLSELIAAARALGGGPAGGVAAALLLLRQRHRLGYLDITYNGVPDATLWRNLWDAARHLANSVLGVPVKVRLGPRDYHSTEQSETDGPPDLLSLRLLARESEAVRLGRYDDRFLHAQALGTARAMADAGRPVLFATFDAGLGAEAARSLLADPARLLLRALPA